MREIKFRAFSKTLNMMMPIMTMRELVESDGDTVDYEDLVIMQYTGLKDKNSVEIYEGDIIKTYHPSSKFFDDIAKITFYHGAFVVYSINFEDDRYEPFPKNEWYSIEVIGNIYENPEMLE